MAKGTTKSSERAAGAETRRAPEGQTSRPAPAPLCLPAEAPEPRQGGRRAAGSSLPPLPHGESTLSFVCRPAPPHLILTYIPGTQRISAELLSAQKRGQTAHRRAAASALTALPEPCTRGVLREGSQRGERGQKPQAPHRAGPGHRKSCREQDPLRRVSQLPKTTAKAAERFFSAQILLSGSLRTLQPGCPRCRTLPRWKAAPNARLEIPRQREQGRARRHTQRRVPEHTNISSPLLLRRSSARAAPYLPGWAVGKAGGFTDL